MWRKCIVPVSWLAPYLACTLVSWRKETSHFLDFLIKGNGMLTLGDQILSTLVVFLQTDFASPIQRK